MKRKKPSTGFTRPPFRVIENASSVLGPLAITGGSGPAGIMTSRSRHKGCRRRGLPGRGWGRGSHLEEQPVDHDNITDSGLAPGHALQGEGSETEWRRWRERAEVRHCGVNFNAPGTPQWPRPVGAKIGWRKMEETLVGAVNASSLSTAVQVALFSLTCAVNTMPAVIAAVKIQLWPRLSADREVACLSPASWYRAMHSS